MWVLNPALALHLGVARVVPLFLFLAAGTPPVDGRREGVPAGIWISGVPRRVGPDLALARLACVASGLCCNLSLYLAFRWC